MDFEDLTNEEKDAMIAEVERQATNSMSLQYLKDTDWYITRQTETGKDIPADVLKKRQEARDSII